jgi:hypothetical protein
MPRASLPFVNALLFNPRFAIRNRDYRPGAAAGS